EYLIALGSQTRIVALLTRVHRRDPQVPRQMVVMDIADEVPAIIIKIQSLLEEAHRTGHVLPQHLRVRLWIARELANVPKMRGAEQRIQRGMVRIVSESLFKLGLHVRDSVIIIAVKDSPESFDRGLGCAREARLCSWGILALLMHTAVHRAQDAEHADTEEYQRNNGPSLITCARSTENGAKHAPSPSVHTPLLPVTACRCAGWWPPRAAKP